MSAKLLTPDDVDTLLRFPPGRAERMAKRGKLPYLLLPTGDIRFEEAQLARLLRNSQQNKAACAAKNPAQDESEGSNE